ncbi:2-succinyl-5-enolpyruvyl-6-hydroxy-3-cyclohexene-1-carboxylate synthase [Motilibacter peucedani]|uniref:2-succinyl-5-enolpyruvyl-6-hydroxy-3-cyclohexene-1-carboxylate synthase n=1 Tax=Motilibacter peucedani TaxID=598650 RepID=A0A420XKJ0_9ACTN|nr:2-succinyl-5-enolpyruvyl-6-hydroxy-3-cyclohexene-1-carboxylic-acid synthase [Motilibacter peucedani]RKS69181.1 2-succinyl-5-enolpyruvyl-6-hydroxy-3-cyclohexene-1-carboxylate synthase [Motilibacter peucedani]
MNPSTAFATVLVDELVRGGVHEAVVCPGSRSAPLAYALAAADAAGRLRLHVRIDERTAGFLALGLAKASGQPVPVVTTSGTATANLHPAVLEASHSGVPLVVLTADRPAELLGVGANQTVDQVRLYGTSVRHEVSLPAADGRPGQVGWWRSTVCRALVAATGALTGEPGPVHLNLALRDPLVPDGTTDWVEPLDGRPDGGAWTVAAKAQDSEPELYAGAPRTLLVVGDCPPALADRARRVAEASGWPVVAEPSSGLAGEALPLALLGVPALLEAWAPERVLVVGRPTLSRTVGALLRRPGVVVDVLTGTERWYDAALTASTVFTGELEVLGSADSDFAAAWTRAGQAARKAQWPVGSDLTGPGVAAALARILDPDDLLVVGSSNPVRDLATANLPSGVRVLANRGVAGIDGTVSSAVGAALAHQAAGGSHAYAVMGDLTFLHDATGLVIGPDEPRPDLCIVVVNDDGGGIFGLLEQGADELSGPFERVFGTPHGTDLAALCAATRTVHVRVSTPAELAAALAPQSGVHVVEVPLDRRARRAQQVELDRRIAEAVAQVL